MQKNARLSFFVFLAVWFSCVFGFAQPRDEVKVLLVGNSFSVNAKEYLPELAKAGGKKLVVDAAVIGGGTLAQHTERLAAWQKDPESEEAKKYNGKSLDDFFGAQQWDFISFQQASAENWNIDSYRPYAATLVEYARKRSPQAEVICHITWSRHELALGNTKTPHKTYGANSDAILEASKEIAKELGIEKLVPAGVGTRRAYADEGSGFRMDAELSAEPPFSTLNKDGSHLNAAGGYLAGGIWYEFLFGDSVVGNSFCPEGMTPEQAKKLQEIAHSVVLGAEEPARSKP